MTTPTPREALAEQDRAWILAQNFHRLYEMLAPSFGYETRADTKAFVADSPNGKLMRAVCTQLIAKGHLSAALAVPIEESDAGDHSWDARQKALAVPLGCPAEQPVRIISCPLLNGKCDYPSLCKKQGFCLTGTIKEDKHEA